MTAGSEFVPVVDDHLVNRLAVSRPRARQARVRAVANRLQGLKAPSATSCSTAGRWTC